MTRKPLTLNEGKIEQIPDSTGLDVGGWALPADLGTSLQIVQMNSAGSAVGWTDYDQRLSSLSLWISTTGNDTTGDGTESTPFLTIARCITEIETKFFYRNATVTINIENGRYTGWPNIVLPRMMPQLVITGRTPLSFTMSATVSQTNIAGDVYDVRITLDSVTDIVVGQYVLIEQCSTLNTINGCHRIQSIDSATDITIRITHARAAPPIGAYVATVYVPLVVIYKPATPISLYTEAVTFSNLTLEGTAGSGIQGMGVQSLIINPHVGFSGWGYGIYAAYASSLEVKYCAISDCTQGIYIPASTVNAAYATISGAIKGFSISYDGLAIGTYLYIHSCVYGVYASRGGCGVLQVCDFDNNTAVACYAEKGSYVQSAVSNVLTNNLADYSPTPIGTVGNYNSVISP